jgi:hypothetical protein
MNEYPYVATRVINRKDIQTLTCRTALDLASSIIPERKRFDRKNWTVTKNGVVVDMSKFDHCGGDWFSMVKMLAEVIDNG